MALRRLLKLAAYMVIGCIGIGALIATWGWVYWHANEAAIESDLYLSRGIWRYQRGSYQEALDYLNQSLALNPDNTPSHMTRGQVHMELGHYEQAAVDFTAVIEVGGGYAEAYQARGEAHLRLGNLEQALDDLNQAAALEPHLGMTYYTRARVYEALGQPEQARADYEQFLTTYFVEDGYRADAQAALAD